MAASSVVSWTSVSAGILKQPEPYAGHNLQVHNYYLPQTEAYATLSDVTGRSYRCCAAAAGYMYDALAQMEVRHSCHCLLTSSSV